MYILLLVFSLADDQFTDYDALKEALEEFGCGYYKLDNDQYMVTCNNLTALVRLGDTMEHMRGMIVKVDHFIL